MELILSHKQHLACVPARHPPSSSVMLDVSSGEQNADVQRENVPEVQLLSRHRSSQPSLAACWSRHFFHRASLGEMPFPPP